MELHHYFIDQRYPERDDVRRLLWRMPEGRLAPEALASLAEGLTEEQRNVAIVALVDEGVLARDRDGGLRRVEQVGPRRRLSLASMEARRKADYARLEAIVAYCRDRRCQRRRLLEYFGEAQPAKYRCDNCSACRRRTSRPRPEFIEGSGRPPSSPDGRRAPGGPGRSSKPDAFTSSERARESSVDPATGGFEVVRDAWPWLTQDGPVTPRSLARFLRGLRTTRASAAWPDLAGFGLFSGLTRRESEHLAAEVLDRLRREPPVPSASPVAPPAAVRGEAAPALTREELVERRVPRPVGLAILRLVASADGLLAVSGVANVLRGSRGCDAVRAHPYLGESELFGALGERSYEELTADVLAMHAKGFLRPVSGSRRFSLAESGRQVLAGTRTRAQTPAAAPPA